MLWSDTKSKQRVPYIPAKRQFSRIFQFVHHFFEL